MTWTKRTYSAESVGRALEHHQLTGAVTFCSPPSTGQPRWRVQVYGMSDYLDLSLREAFALCVGLAAAERKFEHVSNTSDPEPTGRATGRAC